MGANDLPNPAAVEADGLGCHSGKAQMLAAAQSAGKSETLAQYAAIACFDAASLAEYEARRNEFRRRRDYIVPALRGAGLPVPVTPDGAFYAYADCSAHSADSSDFAVELLERIHVSMVPGKDFGRHEPARYLRLSYATSMERLEEAIARLARYLPGRERARG